MRITDRYQSLMERVGARPVDKKTESNASGAPKTRPAGGHVEVNMSDRAQELAAGVAGLDALKASIADGTFRVDPHAIAAHLVGEDGV